MSAEEEDEEEASSSVGLIGEEVLLEEVGMVAEDVGLIEEEVVVLVIGDVVINGFVGSGLSVPLIRNSTSSRPR